MVRTAIDDIKPVQISVGVHYGPVLIPFLFSVVLDTVSAHIQDQPPWLMIYADNIAFIGEPTDVGYGLIQEHHLTGTFIRQRILASTISAHLGASRHGNADAEVDVGEVMGTN